MNSFFRVAANSGEDQMRPYTLRRLVAVLGVGLVAMTERFLTQRRKELPRF